MILYLFFGSVLLCETNSKCTNQSEQYQTTKSRWDASNEQNIKRREKWSWTKKIEQWVQLIPLSRLRYISIRLISSDNILCNCVCSSHSNKYTDRRERKVQSNEIEEIIENMFPSKIVYNKIEHQKRKREKSNKMISELAERKMQLQSSIEHFKVHRDFQIGFCKDEKHFRKWFQSTMTKRKHNRWENIENYSAPKVYFSAIVYPFRRNRIRFLHSFLIVVSSLPLPYS